MKNIISDIVLLDKPVSSVNDIGHPWDLIANISKIFKDIPSSFKNFEHVIINDNNEISNALDTALTSAVISLGCRVLWPRALDEVRAPLLRMCCLVSIHPALDRSHILG